MSFEQIVFYVLAGFTLLASTLLIVSKNPVKAALFLVMAFISTAGIWILLHAEFLGISLILVYVGAVMVLFLFVVMMLDIHVTETRAKFTRYLPIGVLVALAVLTEIILVIKAGSFDNALNISVTGAVMEGSNTKQLGKLLYTEYLFPVELAAVLLTVAIVAAIALTLRRRPGVQARYQNIAEQVQVKAKDRLKVVSMDSDLSRHQTKTTKESKDVGSE